MSRTVKAPPVVCAHCGHKVRAGLATKGKGGRRYCDISCGGAPRGRRATGKERWRLNA